MKETIRRRITDTSSLNYISVDQLRNRIGMMEEGVNPIQSILQHSSVRIFKDDVNGFSSTPAPRISATGTAFSTSLPGFDNFYFNLHKNIEEKTK